METKPQTLTEKLLEFQKLITPVKKDGTNPHFKNKYATLPNILSEVKPLLSQLGLVLTQPVMDNKVYSVIYIAGANLSPALEAVGYNPSVSVSSSIELPTNLTPQQLGSAITYFRRYTLSGLLSLEIEDDDGQATNTPPAAKEPAKPYLNENSENFVKALEALRSEKFTIADIEKKYTVSKTVREALLSQAI